MNRRDALKALMALPPATRIVSADVRAADVVVIECPQRLSATQQVAIRQDLELVWPGRRVVVLSDGLTLKIVGGT